jgi:hypothetical protein
MGSRSWPRNGLVLVVALLALGCFREPDLDNVKCSTDDCPAGFVCVGAPTGHCVRMTDSGLATDAPGSASPDAPGAGPSEAGPVDSARADAAPVDGVALDAFALTDGLGPDVPLDQSPSGTSDGLDMGPNDSAGQGGVRGSGGTGGYGGASGDDGGPRIDGADAPAIDSPDAPIGMGGTAGGAGAGGIRGSGGTVGSGGVTATGGIPGSGGAGTGGIVGTGGVTGSGGLVGTGGASASGGITGSGGGSGGSETGGSTGTGGAPGTGGVTGTGGIVGSGGVVGSGGTIGTGGSAGTSGCVKGQTTGNQVVVIGESIFNASAIVTDLEELARAAGSLGTGDSYLRRDTSGASFSMIAAQYHSVEASGTVKYVIMDGGGIDCMQTNPDYNGLLTSATSLFQSMADHNVESVVYMFYADPQGSSWATMKNNVDTLRPQMQALCEGRTAPKCYFLDLRPVWAGHYSQYTTDGLHPTTAGSAATAAALWQLMVDHCVAQ